MLSSQLESLLPTSCSRGCEGVWGGFRGGEVLHRKLTQINSTPTLSLSQSIEVKIQSAGRPWFSCGVFNGQNGPETAHIACHFMKKYLLHNLLLFKDSRRKPTSWRFPVRSDTCHRQVVTTFIRIILCRVILMF
jgi:hypothetical protein